jgi:hypothetical protein
MSGTATGAAVVAATLTSCLCCVSVRMLRSSDVLSSTSDSVVDGDAVEVGAQTNKRLRSSEPMTDAGAGAGAGAGAATAPEEDSGVHLLMNKPPCCLSSTIDEQPQATRKTKLKRQRALGGAQQAQQQQQEQQASTAQPRSTVVEILRANGFDPATTSPVGRLDFESSGALLFTSDGCAYIASRPGRCMCLMPIASRQQQLHPARLTYKTACTVWYRVLNRAVRATQEKDDKASLAEGRRGCPKIYHVHIAGRRCEA